MPAIDPVTGLAAVTALISALGVGGVLRERSRARATIEAEKQKAAAAIAAAAAEAPQKMAEGLAGLADAVNMQTEALIGRLVSQIDRQKEDIERLSGEVARLRSDHETCLKDGESMRSQIDHLRQALKDNGIPLEPHELPDSVIHLDQGTAKVLSAPRRRTAKS